MQRADQRRAVVEQPGGAVDLTSWPTQLGAAAPSGLAVVTVSG